MNIRVTEEYEIRAADNLNWQIYEYKEVAKKDGTKEMEWRPVQAYFRGLQSAFRWILDSLSKKRKNGAVPSLQDALRAIRGMVSEVEECAERVEKAIETGKGLE